MQTSEFDGVRFETFLTPDYHVSHDSLQHTAQRVYRLLDRRFGTPAVQEPYLAVVEMEEEGPTGFSVLMSDAVASDSVMISVPRSAAPSMARSR